MVVSDWLRSAAKNADDVYCPDCGMPNIVFASKNPIPHVELSCGTKVCDLGTFRSKRCYEHEIYLLKLRERHSDFFRSDESRKMSFERYLRVYYPLNTNETFKGLDLVAAEFTKATGGEL